MKKKGKEKKVGPGRVRNIEGKLKREVKGLTIHLHVYFLSMNYLDITTAAPGASICLCLGNLCPAAKPWANFQVTKSSPGTPVSPNRRGSSQGPT